MTRQSLGQFTGATSTGSSGITLESPPPAAPPTLPPASTSSSVSSSSESVRLKGLSLSA
ncbi:hypothetical protein DPMN_115056 [Dreissena polymorpha]|uniref:Uncharacterized protein n=1 Tax=Dreissena polymorpha TaxID=45954 RepID=A0A9D4KLS1_DREPO|nr:hypothetical protein DPMN_115056 [Dreissena polymorpha]